MCWMQWLMFLFFLFFFLLSVCDLTSSSNHTSLSSSLLILHFLFSTSSEIEIEVCIGHLEDKLILEEMNLPIMGSIECELYRVDISDLVDIGIEWFLFGVE